MIAVPAEIKARINAKIQDGIDIILKKHNVLLTFPKVTYNQGGGSIAGTASYSRWIIDFNPAILMQNVEAFIARTPTHELAHLACDKLYPHAMRPGFGKKREVHGAHWQSIMVTLGVSPKRCHSYDVDGLKKKKASYTYKCEGCKATIEVGSKHHAKLRIRNTAVWHKSCKGFPLTFIGAVTPVKPVAPKVKIPTHWESRRFFQPVAPSASANTQQVPVNGTAGSDQNGDHAGMSKFDRCLAIYMSHPGATKATILSKFMNEVNMTTAGASTYYYKCKAS